MGKGALLLVLASIYGWTLIVASNSQVYLEREDDQAFYEEHVLARERALSGFDIVVSRAENDFENFRSEETKQPYRDGSFSYSAIGQRGDTVRVRATGTVGRAEYTIIGDLVQEGSARLGALNFDGPVWSATGRGASYTITGVNTPPPGHDGTLAAAAAGPNAIGVYSVLESAHNEVIDGLRPELVTGGDKGAPGSFAYGGTEKTAADYNKDLVDFDALSAEILGLCEDTKERRAYSNCRTLIGDQVIAGNEVFGKPDNPIIMIVDGSATLRGSVHGYGVLYVKGDFKTEVGQPVWEGLVYASSSGGQHELRGQPKIYGATILRSTNGDETPAQSIAAKEVLPSMSFLVRGEPSFFYSAEALNMLATLSPEVGLMLQSGSGEIELVNVRQASSSSTSFESITQ